MSAEFKSASAEELEAINRDKPYDLTGWGIQLGVAHLDDGTVGLILELNAPDGSGVTRFMFSDEQAEELHGQLTARGGKNAEPNDEDACTLGCCNEQPEKVVVPGHPVFAHLLGDILASGRVPVGVATQDNAVQPGSLVFINTTERADFAQWYKESCEENSGRPKFGDFWKSPRG